MKIWEQAEPIYWITRTMRFTLFSTFYGPRPHYQSLWSDTSTMATTLAAPNGHALSVNMQNIATGSAPYNAVVNELTILEHFNGRTFNAVPTGTAANETMWKEAA